MFRDAHLLYEESAASVLYIICLYYVPFQFFLITLHKEKIYRYLFNIKAKILQLCTKIYEHKGYK